MLNRYDSPIFLSFDLMVGEMGIHPLDYFYVWCIGSKSIETKSWM